MAPIYIIIREHGCQRACSPIGDTTEQSLGKFYDQLQEALNAEFGEMKEFVIIERYAPDKTRLLGDRLEFCKGHSSLPGKKTQTVNLDITETKRKQKTNTIHLALAHPGTIYGRDNKLLVSNM